MCKYCNNTKLMCIRYYEKLSDEEGIKSLQLICPTNNISRFYLSYCPFCGRKLEDTENA